MKSFVSMQLLIISCLLARFVTKLAYEPKIQQWHKDSPDIWVPNLWLNYQIEFKSKTMKRARALLQLVRAHLFWRSKLSLRRYLQNNTGLSYSLIFNVFCIFLLFCPSKVFKDFRGAKQWKQNCKETRYKNVI